MVGRLSGAGSDGKGFALDKETVPKDLIDG